MNIKQEELELLILKKLIKEKEALSKAKLLEKIQKFLIENNLLSKEEVNNKNFIKIYENSLKKIKRFVIIEDNNIEIKSKEIKFEQSIERKYSTVIKTKKTEKELLAIFLKMISEEKVKTFKDVKEKLKLYLLENSLYTIADLITNNNRATKRIDTTINNLISHKTIEKYVSFKEEEENKVNKSEQVISIVEENIKKDFPMLDLSSTDLGIIGQSNITNKKLKEFRLKLYAYLELNQKEYIYMNEALTDSDIEETLREYDFNIDKASNAIFNGIKENDEVQPLYNKEKASEWMFSEDITQKLLLADSDSDGTGVLAGYREYEAQKGKLFDYEYHVIKAEDETKHGITYRHVKEMVKKYGYDMKKELLITTADSSINNEVELEKILKGFKNVKIIVTDHHEPNKDNNAYELSKKYPDRLIVVNPMLKINNEYASKKWKDKNISGAHTFLSFLIESLDTNESKLKNLLLTTGQLSSMLDVVNTNIKDGLTPRQKNDYSHVSGLINSVNYFSFITNLKTLDDKVLEKEIELLAKKIEFFHILDVEKMDLNNFYISYNKYKLSEKTPTKTSLSELRPLFLQLEVKSKESSLSPIEDVVYKELTKLYMELSKLGKKVAELYKQKELEAEAINGPQFVKTYENGGTIINVIERKPKDSSVAKKLKSKVKFATFTRKFIQFIKKQENQGIIINVEKANHHGTKMFGSLRMPERINLNKLFKRVNEKIPESILVQGHEYHAGGFQIESKRPINLENVVKIIEEEIKTLRIENNMKLPEAEVLDDLNALESKMKILNVLGNDNQTVVLDVKKLNVQDSIKGIEVPLIDSDLDTKNYSLVYPNFDKTLIIPNLLIKKIKSMKDQELGLEFRKMADGSLIGDRVVSIENAKKPVIKRKERGKHQNGIIELTDEQLIKDSFFVKHLKKGRTEEEFLEEGRKWLRRTQAAIVETLGTLGRESLYSIDTETIAEGLAGAFSKTAILSDIGINEVYLKGIGQNLNYESALSRIFETRHGTRILLPEDYENVEEDNLTEISKEEYEERYKNGDKNIIRNENISEEGVFYEIKYEYPEVFSIYKSGDKVIINEEVGNRYLSAIIDVSKNLYSIEELANKGIKKVSKELFEKEKKEDKKYELNGEYFISENKNIHSFDKLDSGEYKVSFSTLQAPLALEKLTNITTEDIKTEGISIKELEVLVRQLIRNPKKSILQAFNNNFDNKILQQVPFFAELINGEDIMVLDSARLSSENKLSSDEEYFIELTHLNKLGLKNQFVNNYLTDYSFESRFEKNKKVVSTDGLVSIQWIDDSVIVYNGQTNTKIVVIEDTSEMNIEDIYQELGIKRELKNSRKYSVVRLIEQYFLDVLREYNAGEKDVLTDALYNVNLNLGEPLNTDFNHLLMDKWAFKNQNMGEMLLAKYGLDKITNILKDAENQEIREEVNDILNSTKTVTQIKKSRKTIKELFLNYVIDKVNEFKFNNKELAIKFQNGSTMKSLIARYNSNKELVDKELITEDLGLDIEFVNNIYDLLEKFDNEFSENGKSFLEEFEELHNNAEATNADATTERLVVDVLLSKKMRNPIFKSNINPARLEYIKQILKSQAINATKEEMYLMDIDNSYSTKAAKKYLEANGDDSYDVDITNNFVKEVEKRMKGDKQDLLLKFEKILPATTLIKINSSEISEEEKAAIKYGLAINVMKNTLNKVKLKDEQIGIVEKVLSQKKYGAKESDINIDNFYDLRSYMLKKHGVTIDIEKALLVLSSEEKELKKIPAKDRSDKQKEDLEGISLSKKAIKEVDKLFTKNIVVDILKDIKIPNYVKSVLKKIEVDEDKFKTKKKFLLYIADKINYEYQKQYLTEVEKIPDLRAKVQMKESEKEEVQKMIKVYFNPIIDELFDSEKGNDLKNIINKKLDSVFIKDLTDEEKKIEEEKRKNYILVNNSKNDLFGFLDLFIELETKTNAMEFKSSLDNLNLDESGIESKK